MGYVPKAMSIVTETAHKEARNKSIFHSPEEVQTKL